MKKYSIIFLFTLLIFPLHAKIFETPFIEHLNGRNKYVDVTVDGIPATFTFDTGCSGFYINKTLFTKLLAQGKVRKSDLKDVGEVIIANGKVTRSNKRFLIREVQLAGYTFRNVVAEVGLEDTPDAPLLLGQSILERLRWYKISNNSLSFEPCEESLQEAMSYSLYHQNDSTHYKDIAKRLLPYERNGQLPCFFRESLYFALYYTHEYATAHSLAEKLRESSCIQENDLTEYELGLYYHEAVQLYDATKYEESLHVALTAWPLATSYKNKGVDYQKHLGHLCWCAYKQLGNEKQAAAFEKYR